MAFKHAGRMKLMDRAKANRVRIGGSLLFIVVWFRAQLSLETEQERTYLTLERQLGAR